jgi:hypothetical protein
MVTARDLLLLLPERGWAVVRLDTPWPLTVALSQGWVKAHRSGPATGTYEVRLTGAGRKAREL